MDALSADSLSDLHLEACVTAIRGYCRLEGITQEHLAACIGITPVELSYILRSRRAPGWKFERGVERAALPAELKEALLTSLWAARHYRGLEAAELRYRAGQQPLAELAAEMERQYTLVGGGPLEEERARRIHRRLYRSCQALTRSPERAGEDPYAFVRLCAMQAEIGCILDELYGSLGAALLAERIAAALPGRDSGSRVREMYAPQVHVARIKGVTCYNLRLYRLAYEQCLRAEASPEARERPDTWLPHTVRDKLKALAHLPRFSIQEAERMAGEGYAACASATWDAAGAEMFSFLIDLSLVSCHVSYGGHANLARARRIMEGRLAAIRGGRLGMLTPLHQVLFYVTLAEVEQAPGGAAGPEGEAAGEGALRAALSIASQAGLANQLQKIRRRYGALALALAEQEGIALA